MTIRTWLYGAAAVTGAALSAPAALAECTPEHLTEAAARFFTTTDATAPPAGVSAALKAAGDACPADPFVQKIVALGQANLATRAGQQAGDVLGYASEAYLALGRMHRSIPSDGTSRYIFNPSNQRVLINFEDSYQVSKRVIEILLSAEALAGRVAPSNPAPKPGDAPVKCDVYQTGVTQEVSFWIRGKQDSPGGMNIINRAIANCEGNDYNWASIHAHRARATLAMLKRNPARADAAALLDSIHADIGVLKAKRDYTSLDWSASDQGDLDSMSWTMIAAGKSGMSVPAGQWFTGANINKPMTNMSIAAALDAAYAKDFADAGDAPNAFRGYRAVITDAYTRATQLPPDQSRAARKSLNFAAKMHADGNWRSEANKGLRKPPEFLYNWIDPDYKPPAAPAAPAAATP